ncbi:MAG: F0F1 ATP synthase subunit delta [Elainellaceae cyanobacterium]
MLIDPVTVLAQIINFLVLVLLLKRFLYKPITRAMAQRQQTIAAQLEQAAQQEALARQEAARLAQMQQDFSAHRDQRLAQLRTELDEQRLTLLEQAKAEVSDAKHRWHLALEQEQAAVLRRFQQQAIAVLTQTLRRALQDLATAPLERQMVETFLERLKTIPEPEQQILQRALQQSPATLYSSFPLEAATQQAITSALQAQTAERSAEPSFEVDPALGCGIALQVAGYQMAWNLADYLDDLERSVAAVEPLVATPSMEVLTP